MNKYERQLVGLIVAIIAVILVGSLAAWADLRAALAAEGARRHER
jgi:biopolymer transport protein ExbB/TolQ